LTFPAILLYDDFYATFGGDCALSPEFPAIRFNSWFAIHTGLTFQALPTGQTIPAIPFHPLNPLFISRSEIRAICFSDWSDLSDRSDLSAIRSSSTIIVIIVYKHLQMLRLF
jgi:hypothetical protein